MILTSNTYFSLAYIHSSLLNISSFWMDYNLGELWDTTSYLWCDLMRVISPRLVDRQLQQFWLILVFVSFNSRSRYFWLRSYGWSFRYLTAHCESIISSKFTPACWAYFVLESLTLLMPRIYNTSLLCRPNNKSKLIPRRYLILYFTVLFYKDQRIRNERIIYPWHDPIWRNMGILKHLSLLSYFNPEFHSLHLSHFFIFLCFRQRWFLPPAQSTNYQP